MNRRTYLATAGAAVAGLAGCLGDREYRIADTAVKSSSGSLSPGETAAETYRLHGDDVPQGGTDYVVGGFNRPVLEYAAAGNVRDGSGEGAEEGSGSDQRDGEDAKANAGSVSWTAYTPRVAVTVERNERLPL